MPPSYDAGGFRSSLYYARLSNRRGDRNGPRGRLVEDGQLSRVSYLFYPLMRHLLVPPLTAASHDGANAVAHRLKRFDSSAHAMSTATATTASHRGGKSSCFSGFFDGRLAIQASLRQRVPRRPLCRVPGRALPRSHLADSCYGVCTVDTILAPKRVVPGG